MEGKFTDEAFFQKLQEGDEGKLKELFLCFVCGVCPQLSRTGRHVRGHRAGYVCSLLGAAGFLQEHLLREGFLLQDDTP